MALYPLQTIERDPCGLFPLRDGQAIEGGNVVLITANATTPSTAEIIKWNDTTGLGYGTYGEESELLSLIGLFDDSTTGLGYGAGYLGSVISNQATEISGATVVGPNTTLGSAKGTIWLGPGIFMTDQFDASRLNANTPVGTGLFGGDGTKAMTVRGSAVAAASTTGILTSAAGITAGGAGDVCVGRLLAFVNQASDLLASRVQPKPYSNAKWNYIIFKFK